MLQGYRTVSLKTLNAERRSFFPDTDSIAPMRHGIRDSQSNPTYVSTTPSDFRSKLLAVRLSTVARSYTFKKIARAFPFKNNFRPPQPLNGRKVFRNGIMYEKKSQRDLWGYGKLNGPSTWSRVCISQSDTAGPIRDSRGMV